jgi:7-cyano-7-deazaguanine synthase
MKAIILFSGGIDSTVILADALSKGRDCLALSFDYGQRHRVELEQAKKIAKIYGVPHRIIHIDPQTFDQSSLVNEADVPINRTAEDIESGGIPSTYVPARNTLFLSYALGQAEIFEAQEIYIGCNKDDRLPYPDCRPAFIEAFQALIATATKQSVTAKPPKLVAPLLDMTKKDIVEKGRTLKVPLEMTHSCYNPDRIGDPCYACGACIIRKEAGV